MRFAQRTGLTAWRCRYCSEAIVEEPGGKLYSAHDGTRHDQLECFPQAFADELKRRNPWRCRNCGFIGTGDTWGGHACSTELMVERGVTPLPGGPSAPRPVAQPGVKVPPGTRAVNAVPRSTLLAKPGKESDVATGGTNSQN